MVGGNLIAVVTVMLPVAGFLIRWVAFGANPTTSGSADTLAWSAPISQLAWTGSPSVLLALVIVFLAGAFDAIRLLPEPRRRRTILESAFVAAAFVFATVAAPWPYMILFVLTVPSAIALGMWARRLRRQQRRLTYRHGWLLAVPIVIGSSAVFGLTGTPPGTTVAAYTFAASTHLNGSRFVQLGENDTGVLLQPCGASSSLDIVNREDVLIETAVSSVTHETAPSLLGMAFQHQSADAGYQSSC